MLGSLIVGLLMTIGCGSPEPEPVTVSGMITIDDKPIPEGSVSFTALEKGIGKSTTAEIRDGRYEAHDVPRGKVMMRFHAMRDTGETYVEDGQTFPVLVPIVPRKYETGFEFDFREDSTTQNFELDTIPGEDDDWDPMDDPAVHNKAPELETETEEADEP